MLLGYDQLGTVTLATTPAPSPTINHWLPGLVIDHWRSDGTNVTVPLASLDLLDAAGADAATGDSRQVLLAFLEAWYQWYLATSNTPTLLDVFLATSLTDTGLQYRQYQCSFVVSRGTVTVNAEA